MSPEEKRELVRVAAQVRFSAGPVPPPEALERYNQILPGAADRIMKMAESQHDRAGRKSAANTLLAHYPVIALAGASPGRACDIFRGHVRPQARAVQRRSPHGPLGFCRR
ncbi:MAG: DUF2335 domain-containing protein [Terriglobales bacterium]